MNLNRKYIKNKELKKYISKFSKLSITDIETLSMDDELELTPWYEHSILYWDPTLETWEDFNKRIDALFNRYKELYKKRTEEFLRQNNFIKGKEKRKEEHIKWLVLYQIKGWELNQVADYIVEETDKCYEESNIYKNVKDIADLIGITIRKRYTKNHLNYKKNC